MTAQPAIRRVHVRYRSLSPAAAEVWVSAEVAGATPGAVGELHGRVMGPRCRYATTVEVAYPLRPLPPLPVRGYAPPRPMATVQAAFQFAAEHPEILSYVPCFCGCQNPGHRGNDDCFVAGRAANGDVTEWEPHGMT